MSLDLVTMLLANGTRTAENEVKPQMYGAVGDNVHDDADAIQAAVNSGKPVYIPKGIYKMGHSIEVGTGVSITGDMDGGDQQSYLSFTSGDGFVIKGNHIQIKDLFIRGSGSGSGIKTDSVSETVTDGDPINRSKIILDNIWLANFAVGFELRSYLTYISRCYVYNCTTGYKFPRGTGVRMYGLYACSCTTGYYVGLASSSMISCGAETIPGTAFEFTTNASNVRMIGCGTESIAGRAIDISYGKRITVDGFRMWPTPENTTDGVIYLDHAEECRLIGVNDRNFGTSNVLSYVKYNYGYANSIEGGNIVNAPALIVSQESTMNANKMTVRMMDYPASDNGSQHTVSQADFLSNIMRRLQHYQYDGELIFKISGLDGDFDLSTKTELTGINKARKIVITTANDAQKLFDTGPQWFRIIDCVSVIEFRNLTFKPNTLESNLRHFFTVDNSTVIFRNCDFSQLSGDNKQPYYCVEVFNGSTVKFVNCIQPSTADHYLYSKDDSCIVVYSPALTGISVTTAPTKTAYTEGETFDKSGMVITATYADGTTKTVTGYKTTPTATTPLTTDDTSVTISYTEGGWTRTATQAITVTAEE